MPEAGFPLDRIEISKAETGGAPQDVSIPGGVAVQCLAIGAAAGAGQTGRGVFDGRVCVGPVLIAALWKRIPVVVMEPNAVPGFTHRKLARFVARALVSFEESAKWFPAGRTELTGLPVREEFFGVPETPPGMPLTILITGGSQGSRTLNRASEESWPLWPKGSVRLIHQTGRNAFQELAPRFKESGMDGQITAFVNDMPATFARADLMICRSGMGTVSELAASGKPAILVPLPTASDQHQLHNAEAFAKAGAGIVVLDAEMTGGRLVEDVLKLAGHPGKADGDGAVGQEVRAGGGGEKSGGRPGDHGLDTLTSHRKAETIRK